MRVYFTPAEPGRVTGRLLSNEEVPGSPVVLLSGTGVAKKCKKTGGKKSAVATKKKCKKKK
ncbi:MAG: hypothetical protein ACXWW8_03575 [Solirubrobacterales bacterium]